MNLNWSPRFRTNSDLPGTEKLALVEVNASFLESAYRPLPHLHEGWGLSSKRFQIFTTAVSQPLFLFAANLNTSQVAVNLMMVVRHAWTIQHRLCEGLAPLSDSVGGSGRDSEPWAL